MPESRQGKTLDFLGVGWTLDSYFGWGVFGLNLVIQLLKRNLAIPVPIEGQGAVSPNLKDRDLLETAFEAKKQFDALLEGEEGGEIHLPFPVIHPLGDFLEGGDSERFYGAPDLGMVFLCNTHFPAEDLERVRRFDRILAGSTWNAEILRAASLPRVDVALQGVDTELFRPAPAADRYPDRYVIFSGGKLEYRKGQDLVLEAFKRFRQRHPDALLLVSWHNFWADSLDTLRRSPHVTGVPGYNTLKHLRTADWLMQNGLPEDSFEALPPLENDRMIGHLRAADIALFPNRAEGGTNLVAMECLAAGLPVILSENTGHLDLTRAVSCYALKAQSPVASAGPEDGVEGWGESDLDEIVEALEWAYQNRDAAREMGLKASGQMAPWGWGEKVETLFGQVREAFEALG